MKVIITLGSNQNQEENIKEFRLVLTYCTRLLIEIGLGLLGMDTPKKM